MSVPGIGPVGEPGGLQHQLRLDQNRLREDQKKLKDDQEAARRVIAADEARVKAGELAIAAATVPRSTAAEHRQEPAPQPPKSPQATGGSATGTGQGTDVYL